MTLDALIMAVGALVAVLPFLGFPSNWDRVMFLIAGIIVVALGIVVRRRMPRGVPRTYVESKPTDSTHEA